MSCRFLTMIPAGVAVERVSTCQGKGLREETRLAVKGTSLSVEMWKALDFGLGVTNWTTPYSSLRLF